MVPGRPSPVHFRLSAVARGFAAWRQPGELTAGSRPVTGNRCDDDDAAADLTVPTSALSSDAQCCSAHFRRTRSCTSEGRSRPEGRKWTPKATPKVGVGMLRRGSVPTS